jgi:uncharacterized protein
MPLGHCFDLYGDGARSTRKDTKMQTANIHETFDALTLSPEWQWYCPPARWAIQEGFLVLEPDAKTDFWQRTYYGVQNDNGHFLYREIAGDFTLSTHLRFFPAHQYDQAGLMVRFSSECWIKTSVEYEPHGPANLGVVVTDRGFSDWSTQPFPDGQQSLDLRLTRQGSDYLVHYRVSNRDSWSQLRIAHLDVPPASAVQCGLYACSPVSTGFRAEFDDLTIETPA